MVSFDNRIFQPQNYLEVIRFRKSFPQTESVEHWFWWILIVSHPNASCFFRRVCRDELLKSHLVPCITRLWPAVCEGKRNGIRWSSKIYSIKPFHISQQQVMKRVSRNAYRIYMKRWNWAYYIMYPLSWAYSNNNLIIIFAYCLKATDFESEVDYKWIVHDGFTRLTEVK